MGGPAGQGVHQDHAATRRCRSSSARCCSPRSCPTSRSWACSTPGDGWLRQKFGELGVLQFEDWEDTGADTSACSSTPADQRSRRHGAQLGPGRCSSVQPGRAACSLRRWPTPPTCVSSVLLTRLRPRGWPTSRRSRRRAALAPAASTPSWPTCSRRLVRFFDKRGSWSLTPEGRAEHAELLRPTSPTPGCVGGVDRRTGASSGSNDELLATYHRVAAGRARSAGCRPCTTRRSARTVGAGGRARAHAVLRPRLGMAALERVEAGEHRLVHQADDRLVPHRLVRAARGPARHARASSVGTSRRSGPDGSLRARCRHRHGHAVRRRRRPRPRRRGRARPLARRARQRRARGRRHHRRGARCSTDDEKLDLWRAVREAVDVPVVAGTGTNDTAPRRRAHRRRPPGRGVDGVLVVDAVLQPAVAGRPRGALPRRRRRHRPAGAALRHPDPHRSQDRPRRARPAGPRGAQHRRREGRRRRRRRHRPAWWPTAPDGFELYSGDDDQTLPLLAIGAVGVIGVATHWARPSRWAR